MISNLYAVGPDLRLGCECDELDSTMRSEWRPPILVLVTTGEPETHAVVASPSVAADLIRRQFAFICWLDSPAGCTWQCERGQGLSHCAFTIHSSPPLPPLFAVSPLSLPSLSTVSSRPVGLTQFVVSFLVEGD